MMKIWGQESSVLPFQEEKPTMLTGHLFKTLSLDKRDKSPQGQQNGTQRCRQSQQRREGGQADRVVTLPMPGAHKGPSLCQRGSVFPKRVRPGCVRSSMGALQARSLAHPPSKATQHLAASSRPHLGKGVWPSDPVRAVLWPQSRLVSRKRFPLPEHKRRWERAHGVLLLESHQGSQLKAGQQRSAKAPGLRTQAHLLSPALLSVATEPQNHR